jgi:hypothetical protein
MIRAGILAAFAAGCELAALGCSMAASGGLLVASGLILLAAAWLSFRRAEQ